jgi:hypothetical protein
MDEKEVAMKRDFELIHKLLLELEKEPPDSDGLDVNDVHSGDRAMQEHAVLIVEAGLANGVVVRTLDGQVAVVLERLTWAGHDFMAATRDATVWAKAKRLMVERGGGLTFDLLLAWLKQEAAGRLGLGV